MKLNKPLIRKMIKRIETMPETYEQSRFLVEIDNERLAKMYQRPQPMCGTAECLAGEAIICAQPTVEQGVRALKRLIRTSDSRTGTLTPVARRAAKEMGLSLDISTNNLRIFDSDPGECWPSPFGEQHANAKTYRGRARAAVNLLKAILNTDGKILE